MTEEEKKTLVHLTLRPHVAERLREMCRRKDMTASMLIDRWIFEHDNNGNPKKPPSPPDPPSLFDIIFGKG